MRAISYSGISLFASCPSAFERRYIFQEEVEGVAPSIAMTRGTSIHKGIEDYINRLTETLPDEIEFYHEFFGGLRQNPQLKSEVQWAFDKDWKAVDWADARCRIRGIVDAMMLDGDTVYVYEYKTGEVYPEHADQRTLYGLAALLAYPQASKALVMTVYLDKKKNTIQEFERERELGLRWLWSKRLDRLEPPQEYPPRKSWKCKRCPYNTLNGGSCSVGAA